MSAFNVRPGSLTAVYTTEEVPVGTVSIDPQNNKKYIFVKNAGSTSIAASTICISTGTYIAAFSVLAASGSAVDQFAGARVAGATTLATLEYGWVQVGGSCTLTSDDTDVTANAGVTPSGAVVGSICVMANTGVGAQAAFGTAATTTTTTATVVVSITKNVWGV